MAEPFGETVYMSKGNIPFIITVRDDGRLARLGGKELPLAKNPKANDAGTRELAFMVKSVSIEFVPFIALEQVERKRLTKDLRIYFYGQVLSLVSECLERWGRCYLIDLHAFGEQTGLGPYDIIFGTDHRWTINRDFDALLAKELQRGTFNLTKNLRIYVPGESIAPGERFGATKMSTLAKWIKTNEGRTDAIQAEIYKNWFANDAKLIALALEISSAILSFFTKN